MNMLVQESNTQESLTVSYAVGSNEVLSLKSLASNAIKNTKKDEE